MARMDWAAAVARSEALAAKHKSAAPTLEFVKAVLRLQQDIYRKAQSPSRKDLQRLDTGMLASFVPDFLQLVEAHGPPPLVQQAQKFQDRQDWEAVLRACWQQAHDRLDLLARAVLQPYVQHLAERWRVEVGTLEGGSGSCPFCSRAPLLGVDNGRRTLLCSLCSDEWAYPEGQCPGCQSKKIRLLKYRPFPQVRVEACEACGHYLKTIDVRKDPAAVPLVDEIAAAELDKQAREEGFSKFEPNLAGQ
jgi:formate dehydrogenase maturation protein FdhE